MKLTVLKPYLILSTLTAFVSLFFWLIFYYNLPRLIGFPQSSLETVFANYDGPNYLVIAKCGYDTNCIRSQFSLPQPLEYYPAHFPGFPFIIKFFDLFTTGPKAMLLASFFGSILLSLTCFQFFRIKLAPKTSFWLSLLFLFFPTRLLALRVIGAPENYFISFILLSVISHRHHHYLKSAIFASLALAFKSPGVILGFAYLFLAIRDYFNHLPLLNIIKKYYTYLLLPITLLIIFGLYWQQTGDFWAYFHSGDNIHLYWLPYSVFISNHSWINTIWLEEVIYILLLTFFGLKLLFRRYQGSLIFIFPFLFTLATLFVGHRDISRYISPVYPFILLAYYSVLSSRFAKIIFIILLPAAILYTTNFIIGNTAPIADWSPYL